jgi:hypothetical protein
MSTDEINHQLRTALHFTPDDLEANRTGRLSDSQALKVGNNVLFQIVTFIGLSIIPFVLIVKSNPRGNLLLVALYVSVMVFVVALFRWQWQVDVKQRRVAFAEGLLSKESYTNDQMLGRVDYTLIVRGERFGVSEQGYLAFTEGETYRVFYTAQSRQVISAEYLG